MISGNANHILISMRAGKKLTAPQVNQLSALAGQKLRVDSNQGHGEYLLGLPKILPYATVRTMSDKLKRNSNVLDAVPIQMASTKYMVVKAGHPIAINGLVMVPNATNITGYRWQQIRGRAVHLSSANRAAVAFVAPHRIIRQNAVAVCNPAVDPTCSSSLADPSLNCDPNIDLTCGSIPTPSAVCDPTLDLTCTGSASSTDPSLACDPMSDPTCSGSLAAVGSNPGAVCDPAVDPKCSSVAVPASPALTSPSLGMCSTILSNSVRRLAALQRTRKSLFGLNSINSNQSAIKRTPLLKVMDSSDNSDNSCNCSCSNSNDSSASNSGSDDSGSNNNGSSDSGGNNNGGSDSGSYSSSGSDDSGGGDSDDDDNGGSNSGSYSTSGSDSGSNNSGGSTPTPDLPSTGGGNSNPPSTGGGSANPPSAGGSYSGSFSGVGGSIQNISTLTQLLQNLTQLLVDLEQFMCAIEATANVSSSLSTASNLAAQSASGHPLVGDKANILGFRLLTRDKAGHTIMHRVYVYVMPNIVKKNAVPSRPLATVNRKPVTVMRKPAPVIQSLKAAVRAPIMKTARSPLAPK